MSHMTEECYTAHPWMLAAKWHGGVLVLRDVIGNPCSAITSQCVWLKLMSHFYWGRVRPPMIYFFFPFRRGRFILEKILRDVLCACLWQEAFLLCFCLVLWDVWSAFWGLLVSVPVCACTYNCSVAMKLWGSALAIRHKPTVAWESMSPRQWLLSGRF